MLFNRSFLMGPLSDAAGTGTGGGAAGGDGALTLEAIQAMITTALEGVTTKVTAEINGFDKKLQKHAAKAVEPFATQLTELQKNMGGKKLKKQLRRLEEAQAALAAGNKTDAERAAAAAAAAGGKGDSKADRKAAKKAAKQARKAAEQKQDPFVKRRQEETEARILALETDKAAEVAKRVQAEKESALDRALSDIPWASLHSRDLARNNFLPHIKKDEDTGEFLIGDQKIDVFIKAEIAEKFDNLLAPKNKGGSGAGKGTGGKPAPIDFEALTASTTKEDLFAASRTLAGVLANQ